MVTNLAMSYGKDFVGRGQQEIQKSLDKYVSIGQLKVGQSRDLDIIAIYRTLGTVPVPYLCMAVGPEKLFQCSALPRLLQWPVNLIPEIVSMSLSPY